MSGELRARLGVSHALLLQGPAGPFFARFAEELRREGVETTKVNFHAGDALFYPGPDAIPFRRPFGEWAGWVEELMEARGVDGLFVFGDCRPMHRAAIEVAERRGARVWCFEEGYLRPDWITLEEHGVNGNSRLPRDPSFYRRLDLPEPEPPLVVGPRYTQLAFYSALNALAFTLANQGFPHYEHHRNLNAWHHTFIHCRSAVRKEVFLRREAHLMPRFEGELSGRYFFVPLQVFCDFQLSHSPYENVPEFVREVVATFAAEAPPDEHIVFKHHPMDRAYQEYGDFFDALAKEHGLEGRLHYCHDLHLPTLLQHAKGTITINSTVGLQSIFHGTAVKTMGTAIYDMPGLTHQGSLESFLDAREPPDRGLYDAFARYLRFANQCNGSFYKPLEELGTPTGIRWFPGVPEAAAKAAE